MVSQKTQPEGATKSVGLANLLRSLVLGHEPREPRRSSGNSHQKLTTAGAKRLTRATRAPQIAVTHPTLTPERLTLADVL